MSNLEQWLRDSKLSQCYEGLREAGVTETEELLEFTEGDIKELAGELGWPMLIRRRMLTAIGKINPECTPEPTLLDIARSRGKRERKSRSASPSSYGRNRANRTPRANILGQPIMPDKRSSKPHQRKILGTNVTPDGKKVTRIRTTKVGDWAADDPIEIKPSRVTAMRGKESSSDDSDNQGNVLSATNPPLKRQFSKSATSRAVKKKSKPPQRSSYAPSAKKSRSERAVLKTPQKRLPKRTTRANSARKDKKAKSPSGKKPSKSPRRLKSAEDGYSRAKSSRNGMSSDFFAKRSQSARSGKLPPLGNKSHVGWQSKNSLPSLRDSRSVGDTDNDDNYSGSKAPLGCSTADYIRQNWLDSGHSDVKDGDEKNERFIPRASQIKRAIEGNLGVSDFSSDGYTDNDDIDYEFLAQDIKDIPDLPPINNTVEVIDAIRDVMFDCQTPKIKSKIQSRIGLVVVPLKNKCTPQFRDLMSDDQDLGNFRLKNHIKSLEEFHEEIIWKRKKLEEYLKALIKEPNPAGNLEDLEKEWDQLDNTMQAHKEFAEDYIIALEEHEKNKEMIEAIDQQIFAEMKSMKRPPQALQDVITGVLILCGVQDTSWASCKRFICDRQVKTQLLEFDPRTVTMEARTKCKQWLIEKLDSFDKERMFSVNRAAVPLAEWVKGLFKIVEIFQRLEHFKDGAKVIEDFSANAHKMKELKNRLDRVREVQDYMDNVKAQLRFDIKLLKASERILDQDVEAKQEALMKLMASVEAPEIEDTVLPEEYEEPYNDTCTKLRTRYGDLTEIELQYIFKMLKKYFVLFIRLFKTYAGLEGKQRQGLKGMSTLMWGVCAKALELPTFTDDERHDYARDIFDDCAANALETDEQYIQRDERKSITSGIEGSEDIGLTGVWRCQGQLWTMTQNFMESFSGFIQNEYYAHIDGRIIDEDIILFTIKWLVGSDRPGQVARVKGTYSHNMTTMYVKYKTNTAKRGHWKLTKTAGKVRSQSKASSTLKYDDFVEAMLRIAIYINSEIEPWTALEHFALEHVLAKGLKNWNVDPADPTIDELLEDKRYKKILTDTWRTYSHTQRDQRKERLLTYGKWEAFCKDLTKTANRSGLYFERPSFRVQQFAFFASKKIFSSEVVGPLDELTWKEFIDAIVRLSFRMVVNKGGKRNSRVTVDNMNDSVPIVKRVVIMLRWLEKMQQH